MQPQDKLWQRIINSPIVLIVISIVVGICSLTGAGLVLFNRVGQADNIVNSVDQPTSATISITGIDQTLNVELATTSAQHAVGLMNRTSLGANSGMLFLFPNSSVRTFWMKDTLIPLDIIFIDTNHQVVTIHKRTKTNQTEEVYTSSVPCQYVLEVNAGWADAHGLEVGDKLKIELGK